MARLFYVNWKREDALAATRALRAAGHTVRCHYSTEEGPATWAKIKATPPDSLVVSLNRLPSHGRRVAAVTQETERLAHVPIVFVDGAPDKVAATRKAFPHAAFTTSERLLASLKSL